MGVDHHVAVLVALLQELFEPVELPAAVGGVAAVEEDEEVFGTADGLHGDGVGGGVEILLEILLAVEVDVVIADGDEAGVGGLGQPEQAVELSERPRAALVGDVAIDDAEEAEGVGVFVAQELLHAADVALEVDVGADVDVVLVGGIGDDDGGVLVVPFEPLGHAVFGVGAAGEEHACHIEAVARGESQCGEEDEVSGFHWHWVLKCFYCSEVEKPAVVGGGEVERADGMDAHFGVEVGVVGQAVEGFGAEEPVGHALDYEVVVVAPAEAYVPLVGKEAVVPPAFGGKQDVHGLEDGALSAVAALDEFGDIAVAEAEAEDDVACVPTHLEGSGELLQVEGREMAPEVAVFEGEALLAGGGEQGGLSSEAGGNAVVAGVFGPDAEREGGSHLPVEH